MKEIQSVLIAGAGAIGSMVAAEIYARDHAAVSVLAGGERLQRYKKDGFVINGQKIDLPLTDVDSRTNPDLVIVACKYHHLAQVLADLKNHVGAETLIISLLNGISSEGVIGKAFGAERIPYAMIVGTDAGHEGNRTTFSAPGTIFFGDGKNGTRADDRTPRVRAISSFFDRVGIGYTVPDDMLNRLWYKFMLNVGVNQVTAVTRRSYAILKPANIRPETKELVDGAMREVIAVAKAEGIELTDQDIAEVYRTMNGLADGGKTSMCQDVEAGRKTEVELFSGTVIELGRKHGIPVPVNETLYRELRTIEQSY
jgi:2-dehydropantoate 2-reductase